MEVLQVEAGADSQTVVIRRRPPVAWKTVPADALDVEFGLHRALHQAGYPVPRPRMLDTSNSILPEPFFVMDHVDGSRPDRAPIEPMADALSDLHALDPSALSLPALPDREDPIEGALHYLPRGSAYDWVRDRLRSLPPIEGRRALLHGGFWPGNLIWNKGEIVAVIDWEDAALGDPISDLACARVELWVAFGAEAADRFTQRYAARSNADMTWLPVWELFVAASALATMADWGLPPADETHRRRTTTRALEEAVEALTRR